MLHLHGTDQLLSSAFHNLPATVDLASMLATEPIKRLVETRIPACFESDLPDGLQHSIGVSVCEGLTTCILVVGQRSSIASSTCTDLMGIACLAAASTLRILTSSLNPACPLPEREIQCLIYASAGGSAKQIARALGISPRTVEEYLQRTKARIGSRTTVGASAHALRRGWISHRDIYVAGLSLVSHRSEADQKQQR